jgi:hypothetical protein
MKNKKPNKHKLPDPDELMAEWYGPEWGSGT